MTLTGEGALLQTERLTLRPWAAEDAAALIAIAGQPHILRWLPDWAEPEKWIPQWIEWVHKHYEQDAPLEEFVSYALVLTESDQVIGHILVGSDEMDGTHAAIAYFLDQDQRGKGYVTEAVRAFVPYAAQRWGFDEVHALIQPENTGSLGVVKGAGFRYVKTVMLHMDEHPAPCAFEDWVWGVG